MPRCEVTVHAGDATGPFGIFGEFDGLTLTFAKPLVGKRVLAQDLAGDEPIDISTRVELDGVSLHLNGHLLREVGLRARTPGDLSSPASVIVLV